MNDLYNSTNSKSLMTYFGCAPLRILKGKGAILIDENNKEILDCGMALGSVSLGYAFDEVDDFVINNIRKGVNFSRPSYLEEQLVDALKIDIKNNILAKFSKSSSMLSSVIPRVCRYLSNKSLIAYPANGSYLGNTDWYLSKNVKCGGILNEVKERTINFIDGDIDSLKELFDVHSHDLACIIMEPYREAIYFDAYYRELSQLCHKHHVFLIFDETVTGYRFNHPLAQYIINCKPDFTIIGKSFANGYALSALIAEKSLMKKIEDACLEGQLFDFSTTHAGESIGLAAAIKTLEIFRRDNVIEYLNRQGLNLISHLEEILKYRNLDKKIVIKGQPTYFYLASASGWMNKELRKEIVKHFYDNGILFRGTMSLCFSHLQTHVDRICEVFDNLCMSLERSLA